MLGRLVARHRRSRGVQALARGCARFLDAYENLNYRADENGELRVLERLAPARPQCVFDVGANVGDWTTLARQLLVDVTVHAFEVVPATAARLRARVGADPRVVVNGFGLADESGSVVVRLWEDDGVSTLVDYPRAGGTTVAAEVTTGDAYVADRGLEHIDVLKLDVEGAEPRVLRGLDRALQRGAVDVIQFEYGRVNAVTGFLLRDFYELLGGLGYDIGKVYPTYVDFRPYEPAAEDFRGPNYLAVRRDRPDLIDAVR